MDNAFNPYQEWLGIDPSVHYPTYFELFRLAENVSDISVINSAADAAMSRVRACRPGDRARQWASLLDELDQAKVTLLDNDRRNSYLQKMQNGNLSAGQPQNSGPTHAAPQPTITRPVPYSSQVPQVEVPAEPTPSYGQPTYSPSPHPMQTQSATSPTYPSAMDPMSTAPIQPPAPQSFPQPGFVPTGQPTAEVQHPNLQHPNLQHPNLQQPNLQQPAYQQPAYQQPAYQQPAYQQPAYQQSNLQQPNQQPTSGLQQPAYHLPNPPVSPTYPIEAPTAHDPMAPLASMPGTGPFGVPAPGVPTATANSFPTANPVTTPYGAPLSIPAPFPPAAAPQPLGPMDPMAPASIAMGTVVPGTAMGGPAMPTSYPLATTSAANSTSKTTISVASDLPSKSGSRKSNNNLMNQVVMLGSIAVGVLLLAIVVFLGLREDAPTLSEREVAQNTTNIKTPKTRMKNSHGPQTPRPRLPNNPGSPPDPNVVPVNVEPSVPSVGIPTNIPTQPANPLLTNPLAVPSDPNMAPVDPNGISVSPNNLTPSAPKTPSDPTDPTTRPNTPLPTEPLPTEPLPTEPAPTEPAPTDPAPTDPAPTEPPTDQSMPTPEENKQLEDELTTARAAVVAGDLPTAYQHLDKADTMAKTDPQMDTGDRLRLLTDYAKNYREGIEKAIEGFNAGDVIKLRKVAEVIIVDVLPTKITIRASGRNKTFDRDKLPVVLSMAIADSWFDETGGSKACQAAFLLLHPSASDDDKIAGEKLLEEAGQSGVEADKLRLALKELGIGDSP